MRLPSAAALIEHVQTLVGPRYRVSGDPRIIEADEDESHGGRRDDQARADDIQNALSDSDVAAVIALRGGAWFTRILPLIDFSALDRRERRVAVFGFSELTPLVNLVAAHRNGLGIYDMGPAFLTYGLRRYASKHPDRGPGSELTPQEWMESRLHDEVGRYSRRAIRLIEGRGDGVTLTARRVQGRLPEEFEASFVGGNLTVLSTLVGSRYEACIEPTGHWLFLEDFNDKLERFDRFFSHLTLAGFWERCEGLLLGDFHNSDADWNEAIVTLLSYHLPRGRTIPILASGDVGHIWPMTPVPFHVRATVQRSMVDEYAIYWPASAFRVL